MKKHVICFFFFGWFLHIEVLFPHLLFNGHNYMLFLPHTHTQKKKVIYIYIYILFRPLQQAAAARLCQASLYHESELSLLLLFVCTVLPSSHYVWLCGISFITSVLSFFFLCISLSCGFLFLRVLMLNGAFLPMNKNCHHHYHNATLPTQQLIYDYSSPPTCLCTRFCFPPST